MGYWDPQRSVVDSVHLYAYSHLFDYSNLYAVRDILQLPTACPAPANIVFQNTVEMVQLREDFPLNLYLLSRIPQLYACTVFRATIIEDLTTHWVKRNLLLIPIPSKRKLDDRAALRAAGEQVVETDKDLANAHRHVEQLIADSPKKSLFDLFAENSPLVAGADLTGAASGAAVTAVREEGEYVVSDDLFFKIKVPDPALRRYVVYKLDRLVDNGDDVNFDADTLGGLHVPSNIEAVVDLMRSTDPGRQFQAALLELYRVVAELFGMSRDDLSYITSAMDNDGFLKQLNPSFEHRGLRIQPYADPQPRRPVCLKQIETFESFAGEFYLASHFAYATDNCDQPYEEFRHTNG